MRRWIRCVKKKVWGGGVVKLAAVGTLNSLNGGPKLGVNIGKKTSLIVLKVSDLRCSGNV